eukprot:335826_1
MDQTQSIINYIFRPVAILISIILLLSLIYSNHIANTADNTFHTKSIVLKVTYGCIVSYIFSNLLRLVYTILQIQENSTVLYILFNSIEYMAWNIALAFIYILLMLRLHHSFHNTKYAVSKSIYVLFTVLICLYLLITLIPIVFYITYYQFNPTKQHLTALYYYDIASMGVYIIALVIVDLVISVLLLTLFIKKIIVVTVDLYSVQSEIYVNYEIAKLNNQQKLLLNISAKYFILSFVATVWTQITIFLNLIWFIAINWEWELQDVIFYIWNVFSAMDAIINQICLYLIFEVNDDKYQRLCRGCHSLAKLCFRKWTERTVIKRYSNVHESSIKANLLEAL